MSQPLTEPLYNKKKRLGSAGGRNRFLIVLQHVLNTGPLYNKQKKKKEKRHGTTGSRTRSLIVLQHVLTTGPLFFNSFFLVQNSYRKRRRTRAFMRIGTRRFAGNSRWLFAD